MTLLADAAASAVPDRTTSYLLEVLGEAAGRRVLELTGPGAARGAALAAHGYRVRSLELDGGLVPVEGAGEAELVDAVVCLRWPAAAPEAAQRRLLRWIRGCLEEGGVLVIGHAPGEAAGEADPAAGEAPAVARRRRLRELELRARSTAGLMARVRTSGFGVERTDADFLARLPASAATDAVQVVARPLATPPEALAVASWTTPAWVRIDLRYAPDEAGLLDPSPAEVWEELVRSAGRGGAGVVAAYPVDDPYGGVRGAAVVGRFFGVPLEPEQLTFAAGVTSLLHDLAGLADGGTVAAPELVHPDLPAWAAARGSEVRLLAGAPAGDRLVRHVEEVRPALVHLDRPDFAGRHLSLAEAEAVAAAAAAVGAALVIDESPAPYLGPGESAATLVPRTTNLVVLRGFTKAYSLGGMRAAFAVASPGIARRVRELVAPMQAGELALEAALRLLAAGDVFVRLRAHVAAVKPRVAALLREAGLEALPNDGRLPWMALRDPGGTASRFLEARGIRALRPSPVPVFPEPRPEVLRLTIPLSAGREALFRALLRGEAPPTPEERA